MTTPTLINIWNDLRPEDQRATGLEHLGREAFFREIRGFREAVISVDLAESAICWAMVRAMASHPATLCMEQPVRGRWCVWDDAEKTGWGSTLCLALHAAYMACFPKESR